MWRKFIKAMDYRAYCMAIKELRNHGMWEELRRVEEAKAKLYDKHA